MSDRDEAPAPQDPDDIVDLLCDLTTDERTLVSSSSDGTVVRWDLARGRVARRWALSQRAVYAVTVDPTGTWTAAGGEDGRVHLLRGRDREAVARRKVSEHTVFALDWRPGRPAFAWSGARGKAGLLRVVR